MYLVELTSNDIVYQIVITDTSELRPQGKVIDWMPEDVQGIGFFQDALGEGCLEYRETAALAFSLINSLPETPTEGVTNHCTYGTCHSSL